MKHECLSTLKTYGIAGAAAMLMATVGNAKLSLAQNEPVPLASGPSAGSVFFCNEAALNSSERAFHRRLTERLLASQRAVVELPNGYEFQFRPEDVSVADVAQWVVAEGKCCPFFNFHIDLEKQGTLVCLGLTGAAGIKPFIRSEFKVPERK
jgi:hypothetical protein